MANNPNPLGFAAVCKALNEHSAKSMTLTKKDVLHAAVAFAEETDRGAVILAATAFEDELKRRLLKAFKAELNSTETSELFGFDKPLGSFSAKIRLAYALGIMNKPQKRIAEVLRVARNACAHSGQDISFRDAVLLDAVDFMLQQDGYHGDEMGLRTWEKENRPDWPRFLFLLVVDGLTDAVTRTRRSRKARYGDIFQAFVTYMAAKEELLRAESPTQSPPSDHPPGK